MFVGEPNRLADFDLIGHDREVGDLHYDMLGQLSAVIRADATLQNQPTSMTAYPEVAHLIAEPAMQARRNLMSQPVVVDYIRFGDLKVYMDHSRDFFDG